MKETQVNALLTTHIHSQLVLQCSANINRENPERHHILRSARNQEDAGEKMVRERVAK